MFVLNSGARDAAVCTLRWEWEVRSSDLRYSIFVIPKNTVIDGKGKVRGAVKGRFARSRSAAHRRNATARGVRESTVADILWHEHRSITGHYSVAQIDELVTALDFIADEHGRGNKTLQMLQLEAKKQVVA